MSDYSSPQASNSPLLGIAINLFVMIFTIVMIAGYWKVYKKAGFPGWAAIIPFYNLYILLKIVGKPGWWLLLYFIPFVNIVIEIIVSLELAYAFGKGPTFGFFLNFLFPIGPIILGLGSTQYKGKTTSTPPTVPVPAPAPAQNQTPQTPPPIQPNS